MGPDSLTYLGLLDPTKLEAFQESGRIHRLRTAAADADAPSTVGSQAGRCPPLVALRRMASCSAHKPRMRAGA